MTNEEISNFKDKVSKWANSEFLVDVEDFDGVIDEINFLAEQFKIEIDSFAQDLKVEYKNIIMSKKV